MSDRTFKVASPTMKGSDIEAWQDFLYRAFRNRWNIDYPIESDGYYGVATRAATASFMRAWGVADSGDALEHGVTPAWRIKLRNFDRTPAEDVRVHSAERTDYRARLRARFVRLLVCYPVTNLVTDDNDWAPGHDGVDLICPWRGPALAICDGIVRRVSKGEWWGNNPTSSPGHPISDGDGIIIIECTITAGTNLFRPGIKFGYGHTEEATVKEGDRVRAGDMIGRIGWARAPHTHFMANDDAPVELSDGSLFYRGVGDRDPMPFLDFARG